MITVAFKHIVRVDVVSKFLEYVGVKLMLGSCKRKRSHVGSCGMPVYNHYWYRQFGRPIRTQACVRDVLDVGDVKHGLKDDEMMCN